MNASDVMTAKVITVAPEALIEEAIRLMTRHQISGIPVIAPNSAVVGIITEADLIRRAEIGTASTQISWLSRLLAPGRLAEDYVHTHARRVEEIMTRQIVSVSPQTSLAQIVALMESRHIRRIPVIEDGQLKGIVSRADLLHALGKLLPAPSDEHGQSALTDRDIRRRVLERIAAEPWTRRESINVKVENGVAELCGYFTDERERAALRVLVENTAGVQAVRDSLLWIEPRTGMVVDVPPQ